MGQNVSEIRETDRARDTYRGIIAGPQPAPKPGVRKVRRYIEEAMVEYTNHPHLPVFEDCLIKLDAGEEKYGSPLEDFNGRSADLDAYQDTLDSINYQAQGLMEATDRVEIIERAKDMASTLTVAYRIRERLVKKGVLP